jgi:hypothetical protein
MTMNVARGTAMRVHVVKTRFSKSERPGRRPGVSVLDDNIPEIRKLLRTDKSLDEIAASFGVERQCLTQLIKRRRLCDIKERAKFISLQKSIRKLEEIA